MQTQIIYNGVPIRDVLTNSIEHETIKDSTGVSQIGVRVVIDCTGIVHVSTATLQRGIKVPILGPGLNATLTLLMKDRRPFKMTIGGSTLYEVHPGAAEPGARPGVVTADLGKMDINHGPRPTVSVLDIKAGYSATIRFRIEFTIPNCGITSPSQRESSGLISFRFWIAEDIDCRTWLTTRTYQGRIRVAHKGVNPQLFGRTVTVPPVQLGFRRRLMNLHESENGLELDFTFQDEETVAAAPWDTRAKKGATDWKGAFRILSSNGILSHVEFDVTLEGPKGTSKADLLTLAMKVFEAKTHYLSLANQRGAFLEHFAAQEELHSNTVSINARIKCTSPQKNLLALFGPGGTNEIGAPLGNMGIGYNPSISFSPGTSATLTGLFLSLIDTPCAPGKMPIAMDRPQTEQSRPEPQDQTPPSVPRGQLEPYRQGEQLSQSHLQAMYLDYRIDSDLLINTGRLALPAGSAEGGTTQSVVRLFRPTAKREIRISATRVGAPPEFPNPGTDWTDNNQIFHAIIDEPVISPSAPQLSADSRKLIYSADMHITYALSRPPTTRESIPVGMLPYRTVRPDDESRSIPAVAFVNPANILA